MWPEKKNTEKQHQGIIYHLCAIHTLNACNRSTKGSEKKRKIPPPWLCPETEIIKKDWKTKQRGYIERGENTKYEIHALSLQLRWSGITGIDAISHSGKVTAENVKCRICHQIQIEQTFKNEEQTERVKKERGYTGYLLDFTVVYKMKGNDAQSNHGTIDHGRKEIEPLIAIEIQDTTGPHHVA